MMTPTKRTLDRLAKMGWEATVVERYVGWKSGGDRRGGHRKDAFGFGDVLACHPYHGIMLVQATTNAHTMDRADKITTKTDFEAAQWLRSGGRIEVWGWRKLQQKTKNNKTVIRWKARRLEVVYVERKSTMEQAVLDIRELGDA